jgi:hypothetical protein
MTTRQDTEQALRHDLLIDSALDSEPGGGDEPTA